jgi:two-component system phosphate regulon sensor histidine kinase PhoR
MPLLMVVTILIIAGFQVYWLQKTYEREERTLEMRTNMLFRETVLSLQASKLKLDRLIIDSTPLTITMEKQMARKPLKVHMLPRQKMVTLANTLNEKLKDSLTGRTVVAFERKESADKRVITRRESRLMQFLYDVDSLQDSVRLTEIEATYGTRLKQQNLPVPFSIQRMDKEKEERAYNEVTLGFANPITYKLNLGNTFPFLLKRISAAVLFSIFLIGVTVLSFLLLYRNLLRQQRLAVIKNDFISNITHELKTPIATVSVAIEALRTFNASMDKEKTKEYLDISANELQRLSLLVDKVLKLSMFEKKEIDLKYEPLNMKDLVDEVTASMRLQLEKHQAHVSVSAEGDTTLQGDRLHLVSVIFNLFDNALKYSKGKPAIGIFLKGEANRVTLSLSDNGIGIPTEYKDRIFEKFFRVPTGNLHNAKGYGLGLSYVSHVIGKHQGTIQVESMEGDGSKFVITLPKQSA